MITNKLKEEIKAQGLTKRTLVPYEETNRYHETSSKKGWLAPSVPKPRTKYKSLQCR